MSTKTQPIAPEQIKLSDLVIDETLSGRSAKEIRDNAKSLAPEMEAFGAWDEKQPGQYFVGEDGKPHLCAGFTRVAAAQSLGYKHGYFFRDESDIVSRRLKCVTTNGGKPVSRFEQGRVYSALIAGVVADDFAGAIADPKNKKDWKVQPMDANEIAAKIGKTRQHICDCITIFESPEEVGAMIESDEISSGIVVTARQWAKDDDAKMIRILKSAIRNAGGEKATKKHMDAIKSEFVKQKAVSASDGAPNTNTPPEPEKPHSEPHGAKDDVSSEPSEPPQLEFPPEPEVVVVKPPTKKESKTIRDAAMAVILKWAEETSNAVSDEEASLLIESMTEAGLLAERLPF